MEPTILLGFKERDEREIEIIQRPMEPVGNDELLQMQPKAFNRIEKRAVDRQPKHEDAVRIDYEPKSSRRC